MHAVCALGVEGCALSALTHLLVQYHWHSPWQVLLPACFKHGASDAHIDTVMMT